MGFQFVRMECFSRKANARGQSVGFILDEVSRVPSACTHVADPKPPSIVYGLEVDQLRTVHDQMLDGATINTKTGEKRKVRIDQQTLMTMVASHPGGTDAEVKKWQKLTIDWAASKYGANLLSVIRHDDESHPHLHLYVIPDDLKARALHPGIAAKMATKAEVSAQGVDSKTANKQGDNAYRKAMREFQDDYYCNVGIESGLTRSGPNRRRLSRSEWQAEKAASKHGAILIDLANNAEVRARKAQVLVHNALNTKAQAEQAARDAEKAKINAQNAVRELKKQARQAISLRDRAKADLDKIIASSSQFGTRVRNVLSGWFQASPFEIANQMIERERSDWKHREISLLKDNESIFRENKGLKANKVHLLDRISRLSIENTALMKVNKPTINYKNGLKTQF